MAYEIHSNFGYGTVGTAPSPATTGTTVILGTENFADFPDPGTSSPYQYTVWPSGTFPLSSNAEIGSVVGKATNGTLYISRSAQGTRTIGIGDQFAINITKKHFTDIEQYAPQDGWIAAGETWTYASADAPTFTFTISGDLTTKYSVGMRIKLTQTTAKYFIVTAVSYSAPNTTVTIYGGTDYTLANAAITSPFFSFHKAPFGFPLDGAKWTVTLVSSTNRTTITPTQNTWYNAESISLPIGSWDVEWSCLVDAYDTSANIVDEQLTLSTANNSESDIEHTCSFYYQMPGAAGTCDILTPLTKRKTITVASKTTYYLNYRTTLASMDSININASRMRTTIRALCHYL